MVDRERISQPPLLPRVSEATILEMKRGRLPLHPESFSKAGISTDTDPLISVLLHIAQEANPHFAEGGLMTYLLLARQAQKTRKHLSNLSFEDIEDYFVSHLHKNIPSIVSEKEKKLKIRILPQEKIQEIEIQAEYVELSFKKFEPENPDLMNYLEGVYVKNMELAKTTEGILGAFHVNSWVKGVLYAYEFLRSRAEKERMKGINL